MVICYAIIASNQPEFSFIFRCMYVYYAAEFRCRTVILSIPARPLTQCCLFVFPDELKNRINILAYELDLIIQMNCTCDQPSRRFSITIIFYILYEYLYCIYTINTILVYTLAYILLVLYKIGTSAAATFLYVNCNIYCLGRYAIIQF